MSENHVAALDHLNLSVRNFEETAAWYQRVFGFQVAERGLYEGLPWGVLKNGNSMLCVYESPDKKPPRGDETENSHQISHFGLRIHDQDAWRKTLGEQKVPTYYGSPVRYPHSTSWYVTDPTGYMIEVAYWDENRVQFDSRD
jgi:catechol 2,3-dioxygenase-like lactoylglutathione lyase family enzyme